MAVDNFRFGQCILYLFFAFLFSFIAVGKCLLFTEGMWQNESMKMGKQHFIVEEGDQSQSCRFIPFVGIVSLILSGVADLPFFSTAKATTSSSLFHAFLNLLLCLLVVFVVGTISIIGFSAWCDAVTENGAMPSSCEDLQDTDLELGVHNNSFYDQFAIAQFGLWSAWLCWLSLTVLAFLKVYHNHWQQELLDSLVQEKELLLGHPLQRSSYNRNAMI
uniref:Transmembrane protein 179a, genome duplicate A n=1 Tax=Sinocyclocheilus rhinocerous TaxID=307959 RepID=A0A673NEW1_9TELE